MRNNVLYFPYISVPSSAWFTRILLYWDTIGSIVPYEFIANPELHDPYTRSLIQAGLVTQIMPGMHLDRIPNHTESFITYLESLGSKLEKRRKEFQSAAATAPIHIEKMDQLGDELVKIGLATSEHYPWFNVEAKTANDYMSYLATVLGRLPELELVPVTDQLACLNNLAPVTMWGKHTEREASILRMEILEEALPAPSVPLDATEVALFKESHGDKLSRFRRKVEIELTNLTDISDPDIRQRRLTLVKEEIREETSEIYEMMQGEGWPDLIFGKLFAVLGGIPTVGAVPKIINAVYKAFSDSDSFDKRSPLAYAAFAQSKLLGRRREDIDVSV